MKLQIKNLLKGGRRTKNFIKARISGDQRELLRTLSDLVIDGDVSEENTGGDVYYTLVAKKKVQVRKRTGKTVKKSISSKKTSSGVAETVERSKEVDAPKRKTVKNVKKTKSKPVETIQGNDAGDGNGGG